MDLELAQSLGGFKENNFYSQKIKEVDVDGDEGLQWEALLRYHFKIDPTGLSDEDFFKLAASLEWVIRMEKEKKET